MDYGVIFWGNFTSASYNFAPKGDNQNYDGSFA
jgi:hypothetical protein